MEQIAIDPTPFIRAFEVFLGSANEGDFVIFEDPDHDSHFIQFKISNGIVYGEVGSRQWGGDGTGNPLSDAAEFALMRLGFTHGGRAKNYCQDNLPADATYLGRLTEQLFRTAYEIPAPRLPEIRTTTERLAVWAGGRGRLRPPGPVASWGTCPCGHPHSQEPPLATSPGLAARALRAMHSNFMRVQLDCEDRIRFRAAVEAVLRFEQLPDWAQDYFLKAEEGPLW